MVLGLGNGVPDNPTTNTNMNPVFDPRQWPNCLFSEESCASIDLVRNALFPLNLDAESPVMELVAESRNRDIWIPHPVYGPERRVVRSFDIPGITVPPMRVVYDISGLPSSVYVWSVTFLGYRLPPIPAEEEKATV